LQPNTFFVFPKITIVFKALQTVVNYRDDPKQSPKISERLNRYIDALLRPKKGRSDTDVECLMAKAITIFRYIDDKDLFQKVLFALYTLFLTYIMKNNLSFFFENSVFTQKIRPFNKLTFYDTYGFSTIRRCFQIV
jgi:hypothetical protein